MWAYLGSNIQTGLVKPEILTGGEITLRNTKIICTLGPAVDSEEAIRKLVLGGMNTARFNFSHDIDLLKKLGRVTVSWSINTLDENFKNDMDSASSIEHRIATLKHLK